MVIHQFTTEEIETEKWRSVVGYEGLYSVSNLGRVRRDAPSARPGSTCKVGRVMRVSPSHRRRRDGSIKYEYLGLSLNNSAGKKRIFVHQLVAAAFIGLRPQGSEVNHIDGNKWNNRLTNLEYLTKTEHGKHRITSGQALRGEQSPVSKLTDDKVRQIRALYRPCKTGTRSANEPPRMGIYQLADRFGVDATLISLILKRKIWAHVI